MTERRLYDHNPATKSYDKCICGHAKLYHPHGGGLGKLFCLEGGKCEECQCAKYEQDKSIKYFWENGNTHSIRQDR